MIYHRLQLQRLSTDYQSTNHTFHQRRVGNTQYCSYISYICYHPIKTDYAIADKNQQPLFAIGTNYEVRNENVY